MTPLTEKDLLAAMSGPPPKNGKDPVLEALASILSRLESLEAQNEEMLEKLHDLESGMRFISG